jgi:hypothetical protein
VEGVCPRDGWLDSFVPRRSVSKINLEGTCRSQDAERGMSGEAFERMLDVLRYLGEHVGRR